MAMTREPSAVPTPPDTAVPPTAAVADAVTPVPRVTIGMPVYNTHDTVAAAIECVLAQTFTDFELVVSDNGSTDGTAEVVARYAARDPRVRLIRHTENRGGAANFSGLPALARGEYFRWMSGDDLIHPEVVARCVAVLDTDPDVVLVYPKTTMIEYDGTFLRHHEDRLHLPSSSPAKRLHDFARYRWLCNPIFGLMRTDVLRTTTLLTADISADITLLAQMALRGKFHEVSERMFFRRIAPQSCGLGDLDADGVAQWFDPKKLAPKVSPAVRVWWDVNRAIVRAPLSGGDRAATLAAYNFARARRGVGVVKYRARLRRSGAQLPTWDSLRETAPDGWALPIAPGNADALTP